LYHPFLSLLDTINSYFQIEKFISIFNSYEIFMISDWLDKFFNNFTQTNIHNLYSIYFSSLLEDSMVLVMGEGGKNGFLINTPDLMAAKLFYL
jgi:hypothetical protein